ncbi:transposase, partial [Escherichia coli]|uniref:transposase n=1 Tax=Escherichia coli TaxID=562 RepID=UPI00203E312F
LHMVELASRPNVNVAQLAREHGVDNNLIFKWLRLWQREGRISCVFRSIRSRIGIEVRSAIRIHSINRELNFFYRFLTRFFAAFH